jgi:HEAT repeat protein
LETSLRNSENWTVRHHAAHLLGELATESTTPTLSMALEEEGVEEVRNQIIHSLGCTGGSQAVDALEPLIRSSLPADQARAARALGEISLPEAHSLLKELLESTEDLSLKRLLRGQLHSQEGS